MTAPARRPWRKKKQWAAALAMWLVVAYPLSFGPACYAMMSGWISPGVYYAPYGPLFRFIENGPGPFSTALFDYLVWWQELAMRLE